jgi:4-alpha-glucanotransferase
MAASNIYAMRVLWFERDKHGHFTDPAQWDHHAVAMTTTHDLPTLAGWWKGRDLEWARRIGRKTPGEEERTEERDLLWDRIGPGSAPPERAERFVTAAIGHVARSACEIALIPLEDLAGLDEQPNLPGTTDQHPNWRRRMPQSTSAIIARAEVAERIAALEKGRDA